MSNYDKVLIRFGDLMLKGKNQRLFREKAIALLKKNVSDLNVVLERRHDRLFLVLNDTDEKELVKRLMRVSGIGSFSFVVTTEPNYDVLAQKAIELIKKEVKQVKTFKVETKRVDKSLDLTSQEISQLLSKMILKETSHLLKVDVRNPELTVYFEVREEEAFIYLDSIKGLGGFPVGAAGKGLLLLSGGIDSPVAGFYAMKQGLEIEGIHFESTPMTSIESAQKVVDLSKKMSLYAQRHEIKIHMVPFFRLHEEIIKRVSPSYTITVMRRMMFRVAQKLAEKKNCLVLVTGESMGQVASQTIESMVAIEAVTTIPILRPLITMDKQEIITVSKNIDTYDLSILPFEDCCTVYTPKNATTAPSIKKAEINEHFMEDFEGIIDDIIDRTITITVGPNTDIDLTQYGFTVSEAWEAYNDHIQRKRQD